MLLTIENVSVYHGNIKAFNEISFYVGRGVFASLTARENLEMGAYIRDFRQEVEKGLGEVFALFPRLKERASQPAGTLSGGEQQMLALGRATVARPAPCALGESSR